MGLIRVRSANVIYDRSEDGDFKVTQPHRIAELYNLKRLHHTGPQWYSSVTTDEKRKVLARYRLQQAVFCTSNTTLQCS